MWLNGVELLNKLVGMTNGFYLRIEVTGNYRLGKEILLTPYRLLSTLHEAPPANTYCTHPIANAAASCQDVLSFWDAEA